MDRAPKQPPFPIGTRLRYVGTHRSWYEEGGEMVPLIQPGLIVTVCDVSKGERGTLAPLWDEDGPMEDEDGEPYLDRTRDGRSIYSVRAHGGRPRRQTIVHANEWEVVL